MKFFLKQYKLSSIAVPTTGVIISSDPSIGPSASSTRQRLAHNIRILILLTLLAKRRKAGKVSYYLLKYWISTHNLCFEYERINEKKPYLNIHFVINDICESIYLRSTGKFWSTDMFYLYSSYCLLYLNDRI